MYDIIRTSLLLFLFLPFLFALLSRFLSRSLFFFFLFLFFLFFLLLLVALESFVFGESPCTVSSALKGWTNNDNFIYIYVVCNIKDLFIMLLQCGFTFSYKCYLPFCTLCNICSYAFCKIYPLTRFLVRFQYRNFQSKNFTVFIFESNV